MRAACIVARSFFAALILAIASASSCFAQVGSATAPAAGASQRTASSAQIFLIKGLAGIFSSGMIDLGEKLHRRGIKARVESHADSEAITDEIVRRYRSGVRGPIIIVGHSLGADVAGGIARRLNAYGIPVALLVTFGPISDPLVTPNVARATNYYQAVSTWRGRMIPAPGFRGSLTNVALDSAADINHFNIEKADRLHAETIAKISAIMGRAPAR
jgi:pimeloyl-ACP methyl ester carboxylesterase